MPSDSTLIATLNTNWSRAIDGSAGNVTIAAGFGSDTITGGVGDVLDYSGSWTSVSLNLAAGSATHGTATDSFTSITKVIGSGTADTLVAGTGNVQLNGGSGGNDSLVAGAGARTTT